VHGDNGSVVTFDDDRVISTTDEFNEEIKEEESV
jgi:hypothetical protein